MYNDAKSKISTDNDSECEIMKNIYKYVHVFKYIYIYILSG